jgi:aryl-alcohol dehydrogenase-like predicted oxidoreductase
MERRRLGSSELHVSRLALGSWRTFERIDRDVGEAVMRAAGERGINFLDDARYDDESGAAPIATGYSEGVFGDLFRAAGWDRRDTVVANKLWWEFWPQQSAREELDASLARMGFEYVDLIYATPPPEGLPVSKVVASVGELLGSGKARAWGILNWEASLLLEASSAASAQGVPQPCAAQLPYSLVRRSWVDNPDMAGALAASGVGVVASFALAGGVLTGKYDQGEGGRASAELDDPRVSAAREAGRRLRTLAAQRATSPAALAIAFALANPAVASVLFGATSPEQVNENALALTVGLDAAAVEQLSGG